jgi:tetratricopeptide (TPR) repeat protein
VRYVAYLVRLLWQLISYLVLVKAKLLNAIRRVLGDESRITLACMDGVVGICQSWRWMDKACDLQEIVLEARIKSLGEGHNDILASMNCLAACYYYQYKTLEALELEKKVLERRRTKLGEEHEDTLQSKANIAKTFKDVNLDEARKLQEEVLEVRSRLLTDHHIQTVRAMDDLADTYRELGMVREAEGLEERAKATIPRSLGLS